MSGYVYAISDGEDRVKIGWSSNPIRRLAKISSDCPGNVSLLGLVEATRAQEAEAHALLNPWRVNGEWFRLEGPVLAFVQMLPKPRPRRVPSDNVIQAFRRERGLTVKDLAQRLRTTEATVSRIENGKRGISKEMMTRLCELGIPAAALRPDLAELFGAAP